MKHRIFVAINLPEKIKESLVQIGSKWPELPCRWTKAENLHITLAFLGYLSDEEVLEVCKIVKEVSLRNSPFFIKLNRIIYGPAQQSPKMVWVEGEKNENFAKLQKDLENSLLSATDAEGADREISHNIKNRFFIPHITIARLRTWEFRSMELDERPDINEEIDLNFQVESIEAMESDLKKRGPEYTILESVNLGLNND